MDPVQFIARLWQGGKAQSSDLIWAILFILFVLMGFAVWKYIQQQKNAKIHDSQLFLFRLKQLGLSNFQIKIINNFIEILSLQQPNRILGEKQLFENATARFLEFLQARNESEESLANICKDITFIYEKLYHPETFKKALTEAAEIEINKLLYFTTSENRVYLGKIISKNATTIFLRLFRRPRALKELELNAKLKGYFLRVGDAQYEFESTVTSIENSTIGIALPPDFSRGQEYRHPYIDVIIPVTVQRVDVASEQAVEKIPCTQYKLNEYEMVVRTDKHLDYQYTYSIEFTVNEFKVTALAKIITSKTIKESSSFYYTFKFEEISDMAKVVLKKFIYEHL